MSRQMLQAFPSKPAAVCAMLQGCLLDTTRQLCQCVWLVGQLGACMQQCWGALQAATAMIGTAHAANQQLQEQLDTAHAANQQLRAQLDTAHAADQQLQAQLDTAHTANQQLRAQSRVLHAQQQQLELEASQAQLEAVEQHVAELRQAHDRQALAAAKWELECRQHRKQLLAKIVECEHLQGEAQAHEQLHKQAAEECREQERRQRRMQLRLDAEKEASRGCQLRFADMGDRATRAEFSNLLLSSRVEQVEEQLAAALTRSGKLELLLEAAAAAAAAAVAAPVPVACTAVEPKAAACVGGGMQQLEQQLEAQQLPDVWLWKRCMGGGSEGEEADDTQEPTVGTFIPAYSPRPRSASQSAE